MSKRSGGIGPTGSRLIRDGRSGTVKFTTYDPADGARNTNAPSFYQEQLNQGHQSPGQGDRPLKTNIREGS